MDYFISKETGAQNSDDIYTLSQVLYPCKSLLILFYGSFYIGLPW